MAIEFVESDSGTGGGPKFATDQITVGADTVHVQYVKLMNGTDLAQDPIPGDATFGLDVDVTRVQGTVQCAQSGSWAVSLNAGTNNIGRVNVDQLPAGTLSNGNLVQIDYDTGAGTQNIPIVGIGLPASGGAVAGGTSSNPIRVDPTGTTVQPVSGTVTANQGGTWSVSLNAGTNNIGNVGVTSLPAGTFSNGNLVQLDYDTGAGTQNMPMVGLALPGSGGAVAGGTSANPIRIDPTGTTTQPISGTVTANAGTGTFTVGGAEANGATATANPIRVSGKANASQPSSVLDGKVVDSWADPSGRQVSILNYPANVASETQGPISVNATSLGDTTVISAPGVGLSIYVTCVLLSNNGTAKIRVALKEGSAGSTRWRATLAADGGGFVSEFNPPWKLPGNTALVINLSAAGDVDCNIHFFVAP